jgi:hypothetical protein
MTELVQLCGGQVTSNFQVQIRIIYIFLK